MQRAMLVVGLFAFVAARAAAQWLGMPGWKSPKSGRGVGISAGYRQANAGAGKGTPYGGWVVGGNAGIGAFGIHVAYDSEKFSDGTTHGVLGIGASLEISVPGL